MEEKIAHVEFTVRFDGDEWVAVTTTLWPQVRGTGTTPITALMVAEAKARKAAR